ncbi:Protein of unknown function [Azotobacter beijerinckii]|uniref:DUF2523 domain-containing protein n=1 Tax=Azotobacter beijerinckii TaxID=170623 RepID=A0A1H8YZH0_9GAMM|nr:DUF2523 domain-containing protein [Azotobacter beijerinckii]SEP57492.1 Protein of unknown function [Azotobacter beijerinckii]
MHYLALISVLITALGPLVKMVMKVLGIGLATYVGVNFVIDEARDYVMSQIGNTGIVIQAIMGLAQFDVAINIYFSAVITRLILSGMSATGKNGRYKFLNNAENF